ncbi:helix-turn-helix domain-containing protein [Streptomyces sp. NPDC053048]|uniref:helix-turn-helix domain-containing protein n=1 Tax=Streptomyces sp. NPDC053048 TaxID=3365694 RepID=UPI0037CEAE6A
MNQEHGASSGAPEHPAGGMAHAAKAAIALRLRYIRRHHPEGPFSLAKLAERAGVSKRTLASAESADGTNLTIETLMKVAQSLGIRRLAYFLDEQVFHEVNAELETVGDGPRIPAPGKSKYIRCGGVGPATGGSSSGASSS